MSGIIGGAGSKSGVIGETEIDYEEGTFPLAFAASGETSGTYNMNSGADQGVYCRVGNIVTFNITATILGTYSPGSGYLILNSLPFAVNSTIASTGHAPSAGGGLGRLINEAANGPTGWFAFHGTAVIYFGRQDANGYWYLAGADKAGSSMQMHFGGSYVCVN